MIFRAEKKKEMSVAQLRAEVTHEWIDPDTFDRFAVTVEPVELAASLGVAEERQLAAW